MSKKNRKKQAQPSYHPYKVSPRLKNELELFLEYVPPHRLSRRLRNLFLEFLSYGLKDSIPSNLEETTSDLYFLLEFLDKAGEEVQEHERSLIHHSS